MSITFLFVLSVSSFVTAAIAMKRKDYDEMGVLLFLWLFSSFGLIMRILG